MAKNIRGINKMIGEKFPGYELVQEKDCVRICGPDTHEWYASCFVVYRVSHWTPEFWMSEVEDAIKNKTTQRP